MVENFVCMLSKKKINFENQNFCTTRKTYVSRKSLIREIEEKLNAAKLKVF